MTPDEARLTSQTTHDPMLRSCARRRRSRVTTSWSWSAISSSSWSRTRQWRREPEISANKERWLGLAFDIAIVNTPLETVLEIRDVLQKMSDAGDIFLIVERQQLVFHVVPQPSRLGWYSDVYARAIAGQAAGRFIEARSSLTPVVTTAIGSLRPLPTWAAEWWAAENVPIDLPISVHVHDAFTTDSRPLDVMGRYIALVGEFLSTTWQRTWPRMTVTAMKSSG
jgi:hypothetical protein